MCIKDATMRHSWRLIWNEGGKACKTGKRNLGLDVVSYSKRGHKNGLGI